MPRCAREISLTGYYHVFDRGNSKQIIFEDDSDRYRFLSDISDRFAWRCWPGALWIITSI